MPLQSGPLFAGAAKPHRSRVVFSSKNPTPIFAKCETPELPLLEEAACELASFDDFQLLPSAAIDCEDPWGPESTPATTLPASPELLDSADEQDSEGERELNDQCLSADAIPFWPNEPPKCPDLCDKNSFLDWQWGEEQKEDLAERTHAVSDWTGVHAWKQQAVNDEVPVAHLCLTPMAAQQTLASFPANEKPKQTDGYIPMWCLIEHDEGVMRVTPVVDGTSCEPPEAGESYMKLWCWTHVDAMGKEIVVPCTDKGTAENVEQVDLSWLPPSLSLGDPSVMACAPAAPATGAYAPEWVSGPVWPFNGEPTTLMLRGLPDELTQEDFLEILDREEFNGYYDFVFLPEDVRDENNDRYAIVNLIGHQCGLSLAARLHGKTAWGVGDGPRPCEVTWALPYQGLADLVRIYRGVPENGPEVSPELRPQIFSQGWPVPFPSEVRKAE